MVSDFNLDWFLNSFRNLQFCWHQPPQRLNAGPVTQAVSNSVEPRVTIKIVTGSRVMGLTRTPGILVRDPPSTFMSTKSLLKECEFILSRRIKLYSTDLSGRDWNESDVNWKLDKKPGLTSMQLNWSVHKWRVIFLYQTGMRHQSFLYNWEFYIIEWKFKEPASKKLVKLEITSFTVKPLLEARTYGNLIEQLHGEAITFFISSKLISSKNHNA